MKKDTAEPEEEAQPVVGFDMVDAMALFDVAQAAKMAEQIVIPESIHDESYVKANRQFIRQEWAGTDMFIMN
ncbi:hypothetical protein D1007_07220 [Hordeum vulgare]|nr:hypothetical protein D1007_07220 [Hordeum vulgare]